MAIPLRIAENGGFFNTNGILGIGDWNNGKGVHNEIMKSFLDLEAAKSAMELVEEVYRLTRMLPKEETYGIASQLKRAATSIVANIAEGFGRYTFPDKARHYLIARGECSEVTAYVLITVRVKLLTSKNTQHALELADRTGRLLSGLIASCKERAA